MANPGLISQIRGVWDERNILRLLIDRDLRVRYAQSFLGYLWTIIDPLANALIYFMLFVVIFKRSDAGHSPYFLFLLAGLLPWQWFNAVVGESPRALISEQRLVKSKNLPREIWIARLNLSKGLEFIYSLPVLLLFIVIYLFRGEAHLDWELVFWPLAILMQFIFQGGIALALAPLTIIVQDIQPLVRIFLRLYFYMCPIIFQLQLLDGVPKPLKIAFSLNPFTGILELYRSGLFDVSIRWPVVAASAVGCLFTLWLGALIFRRLESTILKEI